MGQNAKFGGDFGQLQTSIANISGKDGNIQNRATSRFMAILPAFAEKSPVIFSLLTTK